MVGLQAAIDAVGNMRQLAIMLGLTRQAISRWREVPAKRIIEVERITGVDREVLRPDLYRRAPIKLPA